MNCPKCGCALRQNAGFCPICGNAVIQPPSRNIVLCPDGKYRWVYEMSLLKNPTVFFLVWKIFFFVFLGIFTFIIILDAVNSYDFFPDRLLGDLKFFGIFVVGMTVIVAVSVLIYAAIMGGKYCVLFEMDDQGVRHIQHPKQIKKAQALADLAVLAGFATCNLSVMGMGMNGARTEMYSEFGKVRSVKDYRRRNLIKVNEVLNHNQVYAEKEDFDFVLNYISSRVPKK